jgi:hypothetical protein
MEEHHGQDPLSIEATLLSGPSKNYSNVVIYGYYREKARISAALMEESMTRGKIRSLTRQMLEYLPTEEKYMELFNLLDRLDEDYLTKRARELNVPIERLSDSIKIESMRRASELVRYRVQLEMNRAHGLIKERGVGISFPFMGQGRSFFPQSEIIPDGEYVSTLTGRKYVSRLHGILHRGDQKEGQDYDTQDNDLEPDIEPDAETMDVDRTDDKAAGKSA